MALGDALLERGDDLRMRDLLALEVALHQLVGVLRDLVHQLLAVLLCSRHKVIGDLPLGRVPAPLPLIGVGLHVDQVDDAAHLVLRPDRDLRRHCVRAEGLLERVERPEEVRALAVEHVHEQEPRKPLLVGALPEPLGVDLDTHHRVHDDHGRVHDAKRPEGVGDERRLAGRVDQVDLAIRVLERRHTGANRHRALLLVLLEIGHRRAVIDLPQAVDDPGLEQECLAEAGLPTPPMTDQRNVANPIRSLVPHGHGIYGLPRGFRSYGRVANRERSASTALVWSWETRDSVTPRTSPISRRVRFS